MSKTVIPKNTSRENRKELLQESVNTYLEAIEDQIGDLKKVGKNTLIIGGAILSAYAITEFLLPEPQRSSGEKAKSLLENNNKTQHSESVLLSVLKGAATSVLFALAKDSAVGIMNNITKNNVKSSS